MTSWHSGSQKRHWYDNGGWVYAAFAIVLAINIVMWIFGLQWWQQ